MQKCKETEEAAAAAAAGLKLKLDSESALEPEPELDQLQKQEQATVAIDLNAVGGDEAGAFHVHYTLANGQCEQPVTMHELALKLAHSDVDWQTLVWSPGMAHWAPLEECLGHEAWADQLQDYLQLAIEQASQDGDTELVVGPVEPQPAGTTTVAAEEDGDEDSDEDRETDSEDDSSASGRLATTVAQTEPEPEASPSLSVGAVPPRTSTQTELMKEFLDNRGLTAYHDLFLDRKGANCRAYSSVCVCVCVCECVPSCHSSYSHSTQRLPHSSYSHLIKCLI